jgi:phage baseplate assembly protein W
MARHDIAFPFCIVAASGQAAQAAYQDHVDQMIRQVLLTDPGERVYLPEFGAGLRRLIFSPITAGLQASLQMAVSDQLNRWLGDQIALRNVTVETAQDGAPLPDGAVLVFVEYELIETRTVRQTEVQVV